ncbi:MAG: M50 family metallopeptidase [Planctomycetota bacterium]
MARTSIDRNRRLLSGSSPVPATRWVVLASVLATVILYLAPFGHVIGYPLLLLSTVAHELGHLLTAIALGCEPLSLELRSDGSGVAAYRGNVGPIATSLIAAGGLVGPAFVAALCFICGGPPSRARKLLASFAVVLLYVVCFVGSSAFGYFFLPTVALAFVISACAAGWFCQFVVYLSGTQLALSVFSRSDYLFTRTVAGNVGQPSDVEVIAQNLLLPFWFWGVACGAISLAILALGVSQLLHSTPPKKSG